MYKSKKHLQFQDYDLQADLERIKEAISDAANDVKGKAGAALYETLEHAKQSSLNLRDNFGDYAKERPFEMIGISVLVGMFIGYLLHK